MFAVFVCNDILKKDPRRVGGAGLMYTEMIRCFEKKTNGAEQAHVFEHAVNSSLKTKA